MSQIKAILWDNDGVLVDTERLYFQATREVLATVDVDLTREMYVELLLNRSQGAWHLARERGLSASDVDQLREARNARYVEYLRTNPLVIPGAKDTLARLHGRYAMGIVTSSRRDHFEVIHRSSELLQYVDFVLTGEDYARSKPDPEPYLLGVRAIGYPKGKCLVVEDSRRGVLAAKAAGLRCWAIPTDLSRASDLSPADRILNDVTQVATELLKGQAGRHEPRS